MRPALLALLLVLGCGDDDRPGADASFDVALDVSSSDAADAALDVVHNDGAFDTAPEDAGPQDCASILRLDEDFALATESATNIHPAVAFDGDKLWLTYTTVEEGTSIFDVTLRSVSCDGTLGEEIRVNTADGESELDSTIAILGERIIVGYQADDQSGLTTAIRPFVRIFDLEGAPLGEPIEVAATRDGEPLGATNWMTQVGVSPAGFWVAGTWGVEALSGFQLYLQPLGADGMPTAPAMDFAPTAGASQTNPALGDGENPWLAWAELGESTSAVFARRQGGETIPLETGNITADRPSLACDLIAFEAGGGSRLDIFVRNLVSGEQASIGRLGDQDAAPAIAGSEAGFGVVWLRNIEGFRNDLFVAGGTGDGTIILGAAQQIPTTTPVYPYAPDIVQVADGTYFITWSETEASPTFEVHGRFLSL